MNKYHNYFLSTYVFILLNIYILSQQIYLTYNNARFVTPCPSTNTQVLMQVANLLVLHNVNTFLE